MPAALSKSNSPLKRMMYPKEVHDKYHIYSVRNYKPSEHQLSVAAAEQIDMVFVPRESVTQRLNQTLHPDAVDGASEFERATAQPSAL